MAWTPPNPGTKPLLDQSSDIDARIRAANPTSPLDETEVVVTNGDTKATTDGGQVAFTVANSILTEVEYTAAATKLLVSSGEVINITSGGAGTVTLTIAGGVITAAVLASE